VSQYYRYYDHNGRSVYTEVQTLVGVEQAQPMPRGAVEVDGDTYRDALAAIERAEQVALREADAISREDLTEPPGDGDDGGEGVV
jgi:hypothetical protein